MSRSKLILLKLLTHDYTPWANRYVYWVKSPLGVLIVAAFVALICGCFVASQGLVVFAAIAMVIGVGISWPWLGLRGVACELSFTRLRSREGDPVKVVVSIVNRWPLPVWGLAIEKGFFVTSGDDVDGTVVGLARIGALSRTEFEWEFTPDCRGCYPHVAPVISTGFPFGLWKSSRSIHVREKLLVWPRTFELDGLPLPPGRQLCLASLSDQRAGTDGETIGTRPYRLGDTLRSVHWALTARYDRFIVRERQDSAQSSATIIVDASPDAHTSPGNQSTLEWSIRIAASAAAALLEQGVVVRLVIGQQQLEASPGNAGLRQILDLLARFDVARATYNSHPLRYRKTDVESNFEMVITTDRAPAASRGAKQIVLNTRAFEAGDQHVLHELSPQKAWIEVDDPQQVPAQVAKQWRKRRQEVFCGA